MTASQKTPPSEERPASGSGALLATCALGTERALITELKDLGLRDVRGGRGVVHFAGGIEEAMRACLWLRSAMRVLLPIGSFPAPDADALYEGTKKIAWTDHLTPKHTFAVEATGTSPTLRHTGFTALKIKDAIADALREKAGSRPNVDAREPDVPVVAHLNKHGVSLSLDLSGKSLHNRGYRPPNAPAPLRETLAAALLLLSGYAGDEAFWDPMAGSGTLAVEAAWMAMRRAPGLMRHFAFERWPLFRGGPQGKWHKMLHEAKAGVRTAKDMPVIRATDFSDKAIELCTETLRRAELTDIVKMERLDLRKAQPMGEGGLVLCNPPYAERMGKPLQIHGLYRQMGACMNEWKGWRVGVFCGPGLEGHFGYAAVKHWNLHNGPLETTLYEFGPAPFKALSRPSGREGSRPRE